MDNMEKIFSLTIGSIRKLLADVDADLTLDDVIDRFDLDAYLDEDAEDDDYWDDEDDDCYEDDDYEDDDWDDEEEDDLDLDDDEVCMGGALPNFAEEELAQSIAADIRAGSYNINAVSGLYTGEVVSRIRELI